MAVVDVAEGDTVEAGQRLGRLHGTQYQSAVDDLTDQIAALDIRRLRLQAELAGDADFTAPPDLAARVPDIVASERALLMARQTDLASRTAGAQAVLDQAAREHDMIRRMYDRGLAPEIELTRAEKALADARARLDDITTAADLARADEYATTQGDLASLRQRLKLSQDQLARTILTAPMRGIVNRIAVSTIGGVVRPGEEILQIIPLDPALFVEAKVKPADIAALREGQPATIKLSAYDYTIWGTLPATVTFVSADTFRDERSRDTEPPLPRHPARRSLAPDRTPAIPVDPPRHAGHRRIPDRRQDHPHLPHPPPLARHRGAARTLITSRARHPSPKTKTPPELDGAKPYAVDCREIRPASAPAAAPPNQGCQAQTAKAASCLRSAPRPHG